MTGDNSVSIRPAIPGDAAAMARVNGDAWRAAYRGIFPDAVLDARGREPDDEEKRRRWIARPEAVILVAEEGGTVVGFVVSGPPRDPVPGFESEILAVYVHPDRQGRGIGRRLMLRAAEALAARGARSFFLWTLRDLPPTRAFYERLGGRVVAERRAPVLGVEVDEVAYGWGDPGPLLRLRADL